MATGKSTIRPSYITLRGINLGADFLKANQLQPKHVYPMRIEGIPNQELQGTLDKSGFIGGLSLLYPEFPR